MKEVAAKDASLLDIKLLRLFDMLYTTGSVTGCAERLGQSQPTISIWLSKLRRQLNDPLFLRTPAGMQPTPRADELIGPCREALEALRRVSAKEPEFDPGSAERTFRLCMTDASHVTLLPKLLGHVRVVAPSVRLVAIRADADTAGLLESGEAALALGLFPDLDSGFFQQILYQQDWVCLANRAHPRIRRTLTLKAYLDEVHVGITSGPGGRLLDETLRDQQLTRRVLLELPGVLGLGAIISTTDLLATVPRLIGETIAEASELVLLPCPLDVPPFAVKQHWHARYHRERGNRWLRGVCVQLFKGMNTRREKGPRHKR